jgi:dehydrogenase/reductase SDR family protein 12
MQGDPPYDERDLPVVQYSRRLVVPTLLDETFAYLSRFSSAAEWDPGVSSARMVTEDPVGLGSVFALDAVFLGKTVPLRYEITEFDPPNRVALVAENASVRSTDQISFTGDPSGGTVVQYDADLALQGVARLAAPIFALAFRRIGDRASEGLLATLTARTPRSRGRQW